MNYKILFWMTALCCCLSCKKYLQKVPDASLAVPSTIDDFNALLNNSIMTISNTAIGELGADDYYQSYSTYQSDADVARNCYTWQPDTFEGNSSPDWDGPYQQVYYANVVLDNIDNVIVNAQNQQSFNLVKGRAYFYRAFAFYNLSQLFAKPYNPETANTDLGIPLHLTSDLNKNIPRSTLLQTCNQIIKDLQNAAALLPANVFTSAPYIPSKPAALGMIARAYLDMQDYVHAGAYADSSLTLYDSLTDYNTIDTTQAIAFNYPANNEVLYQAYQLLYFYFTAPYTRVDSVLIGSYAPNDLRKPVFFAGFPPTGTEYFKGSYTGTYDLFCGIATDELYLIRAECNARLGNTQKAMNDLNTLLTKRYSFGTFTSFQVNGSDSALNIILAERRKELVFREQRWSDLRRLNQDSRFATTLTRVLNGQTFTLPPNSPLYVYPIPNDEIKLTGIPQNPR